MHAQFVDSLGGVEEQAWDALVSKDDPFVRYAFLRTLEDSRSVGATTGWIPKHLLVYDGASLLAAMPCYEKHDSYGEFIFDWGWADAALRAGLPYYPKLVSAVPFTPASGARLLARNDADQHRALPVVQEAIDAVLEDGSYSGLHVLFCTQQEKQLLCREQQPSYCARASFQFHWQKKSEWQCFEDFLKSLRAPSRKQVRKERARAQSHGLTIAMREGASFSADECAQLYALYRQTVWEKGAMAYLTPAFFAAIADKLAPFARVAVAQDERGIVAMALFFTAGSHLFGRYWGARDALDALHFELCYYLPIEWGLQHGIERFEAGAQGEHKLKRGLLPNACYSVHRLAHAGLHRAVAQFVSAEQPHIAQVMDAYHAHTPYARALLAEQSQS